MTLKLLLIFATFLNHGSYLSYSDEIDAMESVPDLLKSMYNDVEAYPCVRLLNISGEIGCSNPGRSNVASSLVRFKSNENLNRKSAILVSFDEFQSLLDRISSDPAYAKDVGGVIVENGSGNFQRKGFSPDCKFPGAKFAPYKNKDYNWNPFGSGILWNKYDFPIFLLSNDGANTIQQAAIKDQSKPSYTSNVVEFDLVMKTTKSSTRNSETCLREDTCLPLGGYSVWSSLPPINISSTNTKPIILVVASMDSSSFFRDKSFGAESPISGLISLLSVAEALSRVYRSTNLRKQLVFAVFTGEAWGYIGSRRFLLELELHSDSVLGLDYSLIELVVEIGSVGRAFDSENTSFFVHSTGVVNDAWKAFEDARDSLANNTNISKASSSNPGIPPSSLMSFVKKNSSTSGILLTDYDSSFSNKFYNSQFDDHSNTNATSIISAASLAARALHLLVNPSSGSPSLTDINVNASLVEQLLTCLTRCDPGFSCDLVTKYISPAATCPSHYVGVITGDPDSVSDMSRFIWNFLADTTSVQTNSSCLTECDSRDAICVKAEIKGRGACVVSTTRYVSAYSTRLKYEDGRWHVMGSDDGDDVWTESNWDTIGVRIYTVQSAYFDRIVLVVGVSVTVLAFVLIESSRVAFNKIAKCD